MKGGQNYEDTSTKLVDICKQTRPQSQMKGMKKIDSFTNITSTNHSKEHEKTEKVELRVQQEFMMETKNG